MRDPHRVTTVLLVLGALSLGPSCLESNHKWTLFPNGSGKMEMHLRVRKDRDPFGRILDSVERLDNMRLVKRRWLKLKESIDIAMKNTIIYGPTGRSEGFVAWKRGKFRRKGNSDIYDFTGYFEDINEVKLLSDKDGSKHCEFSFRKLEDGSYELTFIDTIPTKGLTQDDQDEDHFWREGSLVEDEELRRELAGLDYKHSFRLPGKIVEAEGMTFTARRARFAIDREAILDRIHDSEAFRAGWRGKITGEPELNIIGEVRAFEKELKKVKAQWAKIKAEFEGRDRDED